MDLDAETGETGVARDAPVRTRFERRLRERLVSLPLESLIVEHRRQPFGPHSDALARVLSYFRGAEVQGKHVIFALEDNAGWVLGRIARPRSEGRLELDLTTVYPSCEEAEHAVFLARIEMLRRDAGRG